MSQRRVIRQQGLMGPLWWMPVARRGAVAVLGRLPWPSTPAPVLRRPAVAAHDRALDRTLRMARVFGWRSLHQLPRGRRMIDHLLVGPGGVLTVDVRRHPGVRVRAGRHVVLVEGERTDYAARVRNEARFAADRLSAMVRQPVDVAPVLLFVGAVRVRGRRTGEVTVLPRRWLVPHLIARGLAGRVRLSRADQETLLAAARLPATWRPSGRKRPTGAADPRSGDGGWPAEST